MSKIKQVDVCFWMKSAYIDSQICMEQNLEVIIGGPGVSYGHARLEILTAQCHGVSESKLITPLGVSDHAIREAKVELDGRITTAIGEFGRF